MSSSSPPPNNTISTQQRVLKALLIGFNVSIISVLVVSIGEILLYTLSYEALLLAHYAYIFLSGLYFLLSGFYLFFGDSFSVQFIKGVLFGNKQRYLHHDPYESYLNGLKYLVAAIMMFLVFIIHYKIVQLILL